MSRLFSVLSVSVLSVSMFACATTGSMTDPQSAASGTARLDLGIVDSDASTFPAAIDPTLPSVDRIGYHVRAALGDTAKATVELCVSPAGKVTKVELLESSTFAAFDTALLRDAKAWQFARLPGPDTVQTCSRAMVSYHPYR